MLQPSRAIRTCLAFLPGLLAPAGAAGAAGAADAVPPALATPAAGPQPAVLHLEDDAHVSGELLPAGAGLLRWQSPSFVQPFDFVLGAVKGVYFPAPPAPSRPEGEYCFELAGGDVLFGSLLRLAGDEAELEVPRLGRLRVRREHLRSLYRWNVAELVYLGPNGLGGWKGLGGDGEWQEELGQPFTDRAGAALLGDLGIPPRAVIELDLSWTSLPDFTLALGVSEEPKTWRSAFRLGVWRRQGAEKNGVLLADARGDDPAEWEYTFTDPGPRWFDPASSAGEWKVGRAGFGTPGTPGAIVRTVWDTNDIWIRRRFQLRSAPGGLGLALHHDEDVSVWINGHLVHQEEGFSSTYNVVPLDRAAQHLHEGENVIAVHCRQRGGGQYIDVGLVEQGEVTGELVALREADLEADLASLAVVKMAAGRTQLVIHLDQEAGRMLISRPDGTPLADLKVAPDRPQAFGGLLLQNHRGDVRLERLRISRWSGAPPGDIQIGKPQLHRRDGSIAYGRLVAVDRDAAQFILQDGAEEIRVPADEVASVLLSSRDPGEARTMRAVYQDGTQLSGELIRVRDDALELACPGMEEPLRLPFPGLRSLVVMRRGEEQAPPLSDGPPGILEADGLRLPGRLVAGREQPGASCLVWQPSRSASSSALRPGVTGRISFPGLAPSPAPGSSSPGARLLRQLFSAVRGGVAAAGPATAAARKGRWIHFRNGDSIPGEVTRIEETGVSFRTPASGSGFVAHDKIKAVELLPSSGPPRLEKSKRERLLMLPRMQAPAPPTHLVRSTGGDFLRGNVASMDDKTLRVEIRSEVRELRRDRVSHIIWLHRDELPPPAPAPAPAPAATPGAAGPPAAASAPAGAAPAPAPPPAAAPAPIAVVAPAAAPAPAPDAATVRTIPAPEPPPAPAPPPPAAAPAGGKPGPAVTRIQARQRDGHRLSFLPEQCSGTRLSGKSDLLGACRVDVADIDQLLIGAAIDAAPRDLAYQAWKLHRATDPVYIQVLDGPRPEGPPPGTESPLVGKPAPDFELDLLEGEKFRLSSSKGKVVVLDFWASWCGPCLQSMPQVDRVVRELNDSSVELIAINLEEPVSQVRSTLERHKLQLTVALDRDGVVAARYQATAIPQTVVIDRQGKIVRLFVGGGPRLADQLRNAVRDLLVVEEKTG